MIHNDSASPLADQPVRFVGGGDSPVEYFSSFAGNEYYLRFRFGELEIEKNEVLIQCFKIGDRYDSVWTEEDTIRVLTVIGAAIQSGNNLQTLRVPRLVYQQPLARESLCTFIDRVEIEMNGYKLFPKTGLHRSRSRGQHED